MDSSPADSHDITSAGPSGSSSNHGLIPAVRQPHHHHHHQHAPMPGHHRSSSSTSIVTCPMRQNIKRSRSNVSSAETEVADPDLSHRDNPSFQYGSLLPQESTQQSQAGPPSAAEGELSQVGCPPNGIQHQTPSGMIASCAMQAAEPVTRSVLTASQPCDKFTLWSQHASSSRLTLDDDPVTNPHLSLRSVNGGRAAELDVFSRPGGGEIQKPSKPTRAPSSSALDEGLSRDNVLQPHLPFFDSRESRLQTSNGADESLQSMPSLHEASLTHVDTGKSSASMALTGQSQSQSQSQPQSLTPETWSWITLPSSLGSAQIAAHGKRERASPVKKASFDWTKVIVDRPLNFTRPLKRSVGGMMANVEKARKRRRTSAAEHEARSPIASFRTPYPRRCFRLQPVPRWKRRKNVHKDSHNKSSPAPFCSASKQFHLTVGDALTTGVQKRLSSSNGLPAPLGSELSNGGEDQLAGVDSCGRPAFALRGRRPDHIRCYQHRTVIASGQSMRDAISMSQEGQLCTTGPKLAGGQGAPTGEICREVRISRAEPVPGSAPRLKRSTSLPCLRMRPSDDLLRTASHRLELPQYLAKYYADIIRPTSSSARRTDGTSTQPMGLTSDRRGQRQAHHGHAHSRTHSRAIYTPPLYPPITRQTLRELDLSEILKNPQLRHDVVFDVHVQFRPNFDGERGRKKREACDRYWIAVSREIATGCTCTSFEGSQMLVCACPGSRGIEGTDARPHSPSIKVVNGLPVERIPARIPTLVSELREIALAVIPCKGVMAVNGTDEFRRSTSRGFSLRKGPIAADRALSETHYALVSSVLDPALIAQQMAHGVFDVVGIIKFLASILKTHCAPVRDHMFDDIVRLTEAGEVGLAVRMCFETLELMKLDVANFQLRFTRPFLVETAVEFETHYFREQIMGGKFGVHRALAWFAESWSTVAACEDDGLTITQRITKAFNEAFLKLIFEPLALAGPSSPTHPNLSAVASYPEVFQFDTGRLANLHNDVLDLTIVYMVVLLFRQLACSPAISSTEVPAEQFAMVVRKASGLAVERLETVKSQIWCLLNEANAVLGVATPSSRSTASGILKLHNEKWTETMRAVGLQVAASARGIWEEAVASLPGRQPSASAHLASRCPPTQATLNLVNSWLSNNLEPTSALFILCQGRIRSALSESLHRHLQKVTMDMTGGGGACAEVTRHNKRKQEDEAGLEGSDRRVGDKRRRLSTQTSSNSSPTSSPSMNLEGLSSDLASVGAKLSLLAGVNLRTFRWVYEAIAAATPVGNSEIGQSATV